MKTLNELHILICFALFVAAGKKRIKVRTLSMGNINKQVIYIIYIYAI